MARLIDADESVGIGYLSDWYQNSVDDTKPPIWTDEHIEELTNDFIIIPKGTPTVDAVEVVRCRDCRHYGGVVFGRTCRMFSGSHTRIEMPEDGYCSYSERR
jgi:hypothetical protein